eukprot:764717-Hanusia_phi.AAC.7
MESKAGGQEQGESKLRKQAPVQVIAAVYSQEMSESHPSQRFFLLCRRASRGKQVKGENVPALVYQRHQD